LLAALAFGVSLGSAWATEVPPPGPQGITVGELSQVQSQTLLFEALAKRAEAQRKLEHPGAPANAPAAATSYQPQASSYPPPANNGEPSATEQLPVVKLVYGSATALHATLLYAGGYDVDANAGMELPGGYRVVSVSLDSVVVSRDGKRYPLGFSNRPPSLPLSYATNASRFSVNAVPMNPPPAFVPPPVVLPAATAPSTP